MKMTKSLLTFLATALLIIGCNDSSSNGGSSQNGKGSAMGSDTMIDLTSYSIQEPDENQKYALAYMWNEERLAHDLYLELYKLYPQNQLQNIANNSEIKHIELVQNLVEYYDLNITNLVDYKENYSLAELEAMPAGVYGVDAIQDLYDTLYAQGSVSAIDALKVGCMVEVVDVNDLDEYIIQASGNQAMLDSFDILIRGSYKHYWAFDSGLKNLGVSNGCCSLRSEYCKTESQYPR